MQTSDAYIFSSFSMLDIVVTFILKNNKNKYVVTSNVTVSYR